MKKEIVKSTYYRLLVDENKQRLYVELKGFWNEDSIYTTYLKDILKTISLLGNTFDCHANFYFLKAINNQQYLSYHIQALNLLRKNGLKHSGQIMPEDPIACKQLLSIIEKYGKTAAFAEEQLVDSYLDSFALKAA